MGEDCDALGKTVVPVRYLWDSILPSKLIPSTFTTVVWMDHLIQMETGGGESQMMERMEGDVDPMAEVFVGRAPVDNYREVSNFVKNHSI